MLRELARELQMPVIAAAQLNRQTNKQNDYVPDLLGLRGGVGTVIPVGMNPETGSYQRLQWRYEPPQAAQGTKGSKGKTTATVTGKRASHKVINGGWGEVAEAMEEGRDVDLPVGPEKEEEDDYFDPR